MTLRQIVTQFTEWFQTVREIERLRSVDDRTLDDMGIKRSEIARLVKGRRH